MGIWHVFRQHYFLSIEKWETNSSKWKLWYQSFHHVTWTFYRIRIILKYKLFYKHRQEKNHLLSLRLLNTGIWIPTQFHGTKSTEFLNAACNFVSYKCFPFCNTCTLYIYIICCCYNISCSPQINFHLNWCVYQLKFFSFISTFLLSLWWSLHDAILCQQFIY